MLVGALGTVMHRSIQPWGVVVCLVLAFAAAITARAWGGLVALLGYAIGLFVSVQVLARRAPAATCWCPTGRPIGWGWVLGSIAVTVLVGVLPRALVRRPAACPQAAAGRAGSRSTGRPRRDDVTRCPRTLPLGRRAAPRGRRRRHARAGAAPLHAMTASAITSVSLEPPMLLFCVHTDARFRDALDDVDTWSVSVLADDQGHTADWLASPGRPAIDQLARVPHRPAPVSDAVWVDGAAAWLDCRTAAVHRGGRPRRRRRHRPRRAQGAADAGGLVHLRGRLHAVR